MRKELKVVKTCIECGKVSMMRRDAMRCSPACNNKAWVRVNRPGIRKPVATAEVRIILNGEV